MPKLRHPQLISNPSSLRIVFRAKTHEMVNEQHSTIVKLRNRQKNAVSLPTAIATPSVAYLSDCTTALGGSSSSDDDQPLIRQLQQRQRGNVPTPLLESTFEPIQLISDPEKWTVQDVCEHFWNTEFRHLAMTKFDEEV